MRVERPAKRLDVTKGGFYGHFADREALPAEMLGAWERESVDEVLARATDLLPGRPAEKPGAIGRPGSPIIGAMSSASSAAACAAVTRTLR